MRTFASERVWISHQPIIGMWVHIHTDTHVCIWVYISIFPVTAFANMSSMNCDTVVLTIFSRTWNPRSHLIPPHKFIWYGIETISANLVEYRNRRSKLYNLFVPVVPNLFQDYENITAIHTLFHVKTAQIVGIIICGPPGTCILQSQYYGY